MYGSTIATMGALTNGSVLSMVRSALAPSLFALALALPTFFAPSSATAENLRLEVDLDHGIYHAAQKQTGYLRVALTPLQPTDRAYRAPLNVALVIDRSGSMAGDKLEQAKRAAISAVDRMSADDIVSVVAYDSTVSVLVPATKVSDRQEIIRGIRRLTSGGNTALYAGTVKGAAEVRKFFDEDRVNRVILLSDGQANVGPDTPGDLTALGAMLGQEGIGVTTVGLGLDYNEDLMVGLARASGAPFTYAESASDLARLYDLGFAGLVKIVANGAVARIEFAEGFRPVRSLGRDAEIVGQTVEISIAQLYAEAREEIIVEFETPRVEAAWQDIVDVSVSYRWLASEEELRQKRSAGAHFSSSRRQVEDSENPLVMVPVVERLADERAEAAVKLRDQGKTAAARRQLEDTARFLQEKAVRYKSKRLRKESKKKDQDSRAIQGKRWRKTRKKMKRDAMRFHEDFF